MPIIVSALDSFLMSFKVTIIFGKIEFAIKIEYHGKCSALEKSSNSNDKRMSALKSELIGELI